MMCGRYGRLKAKPVSMCGCMTPVLELPKRAIVTAGCGGGVTFDDLSQKHEPLHL